MREHIIAFLAWVREARSSKTYAMYEVALKTFVSVIGNHTELTKESYVKFLRNTTDMNPSTQALYRSAVKGLYLFAADVDPSIPVSFFDQVNKRLALKSNNDLILFNQDGIEKTIAHCKTMRNDITELRDRAFVLLLVDSGLRIAEACSLRVSSIDLLECQMVIIGKGNKQAIVKFSNRAAGAIQEYLQARGNPVKAYPLFIRHSKQAGEKIVQVKTGDMWHAIKKRIAEAGVEPSTVRIHDFRHYFVTVVFNASRDIKLTQELARHVRTETTGRYAHLIGDKDKAYDEIFNGG